MTWCKLAKPESDQSFAQDVRHTSLITLSSPLDPIRSICFAPRSNSTADPFHLISASESGYLARWDLRQPKQPLERLLAHQGGALTLDWKGSVHDLSTDIPSVDGETVKRHVPNDSWGWLASAGSDGNIKVGHTFCARVSAAVYLDRNRSGICRRKISHYTWCTRCMPPDPSTTSVGTLRLAGLATLSLRPEGS